MAAAAAAVGSCAAPSSLLLRGPLPARSTAARCLASPMRRPRLSSAPRVAVSSDASPSSGLAAEEAAAAHKLGRRARVTSPVHVHHVSKAPDLDLRGTEGVVKQYVGVWKGRRITANLPFKVEFELKLDGQVKPVRFFVHLREDEFEFVGDE